MELFLTYRIYLVSQTVHRTLLASALPQLPLITALKTVDPAEILLKLT